MIKCDMRKIGIVPCDQMRSIQSCISSTKTIDQMDVCKIRGELKVKLTSTFLVCLCILIVYGCTFDGVSTDCVKFEMLPEALRFFK